LESASGPLSFGFVDLEKISMARVFDIREVIKKKIEVTKGSLHFGRPQKMDAISI